MEPTRHAQPPPNSVTAKEAGAITQRSDRAIRKAIAAGALPAVKIGHERTGTYWIDRDDLYALYPRAVRLRGKRIRYHSLYESNEEADHEIKKWDAAADAVRRTIEAAKGD